MNNFYGSAYYAFGELEFWYQERSSGRHQRRLSDEQGNAGIGYNERTNSAGQKSLNTLVAGANYDFGLANLFAMYGVIKEPNGSSAPELRAGLIAGGVPSVLVDTGILPRFMQDARFTTLVPAFRSALVR